MIYEEFYNCRDRYNFEKSVEWNIVDFFPDLMKASPENNAADFSYHVLSTYTEFHSTAYPATHRDACSRSQADVFRLYLRHSTLLC